MRYNYVTIKWHHFLEQESILNQSFIHEFEEIYITDKLI